MANQIRLQHRAPSLRTYVIPVEHGGGEAHHLGRVMRDPKSGASGVRVLRTLLPTSITLCAKGTAGDSSELLDESVLRAPEIGAAVKAGMVVVLTPPSAPPVAPREPIDEAPPSPPPATRPALPNALHASTKPLITPSKKAGSQPDQE